MPDGVSKADQAKWAEADDAYLVSDMSNQWHGRIAQRSGLRWRQRQHWFITRNLFVFGRRLGLEFLAKECVTVCQTIHGGWPSRIAEVLADVLLVFRHSQIV